MEKTLSEELDEMAGDVEKRRVEIGGNNSKCVADKKRLFYVILWFSLVISLMTAIGIGAKRSFDYNLVEERAVQEKKQAEEDYNYKHWPNEVIIFHQDDYERGIKILQENNKPHVICKDKIGYVKDGVKQEGFLVTEELGKIIKKSGLRYQVAFIEHPRSCSSYENLELEIKSYRWYNW